MAHKRKARRASKSQGITLNWAIVGLIVVIALLIGLWQITGKPESKAATEVWPQVVERLTARTLLNGETNASWTINPVQLPYKLVGYRVATKPYGATAFKTFDLPLSDISSTVLQGETVTRYYATVKDPSMIMTGHGTVGVYPIMEHSTYAPVSKEVVPAGRTTNAMLEY